jgi:cell division protein FtsB
MTDKLNAALNELRQAVTILSDVNKKFNDPSLIKDLTTYDLVHLRNIHQRVRILFTEISDSTDAFDAWVGSVREFDEKQNVQVHRLDAELAHRLFDFAYGFVYLRKIDEDVSRLTQENASLKSQIDELRQRESTYRAIIERAKASTSPEIREILLESYKRQAANIVKNLSRLQEIRAQSGLNAPLDVLSGIQQHQEELERINISIAELEQERQGSNG